MHRNLSRPYSVVRRFFSVARSIAIFAVVAALIFGWSEPALAQAATTMGDMICNAYVNLGPFAQLFDAAAWLIGAVLIGSGAVQLKEHTDNPGNHPLHRGIARIVGGAGLVSLPFFANFVVNTLLLTPGAGGAAVCAVGAVTGIGGGAGLDVLMTNLVANIQGPIISLISLIAFVMGVLFLVRGLVKGAKYGTDPRANSVPHILAYLVIGGILIALSENFSQVFSSLFGVGPDINIFNMATNSGTVLGWKAVSDLGASPQFVAAIVAALTFFQLIGLIAFLRGWYIVKNAVEGAGQATMAQGFTHIVGGVMAINIYNMLEIFDNTFGTGLL